MRQIGGLHIGRSWTGHVVEDECPCPKAPCGLVISGEVHPDCPQHQANKTIRQGHAAEDCPATHPLGNEEGNEESDRD